MNRLSSCMGRASDDGCMTVVRKDRNSKGGRTTQTIEFQFRSSLAEKSFTVTPSDNSPIVMPPPNQV